MLADLPSLLALLAVGSFLGDCPPSTPLCVSEETKGWLASQSVFQTNQWDPFPMQCGTRLGAQNGGCEILVAHVLYVSLQIPQGSSDSTIAYGNYWQ